ncbi:MAG: 2-hydroxyacyl-CoA dehydratase, partial [Candidatus Hydrogenedentes bacterium]|nr:2-hydroxyacyl-CoA dehydratase [Candidatus Hydrogenedentota bacterium]
YKQVEIFESVCADPYETARAAAEQGQEVAGYMCTYTPVELLHAAGYLPVRVLGRAGSITRADAHLQSFACSLARSSLDAALSGALDFLSLIVFSHTCDTLQNLAEIWKRNFPALTTVTISTPVRIGDGHEVVFFQQELERLRRLLETERGSEITDSSISASIRLYDEHRAMMRRLYALRRACPDRLSAGRMLSVVLSCFLMPIEKHRRLLAQLVRDVESAETTETDARPRVFVVGSLCRSADYVSAIEDVGCLVVDDDLCTGSRAFAIEAVPDGDPINRLARMYLARTPCCAKHRPEFDVGKDMLERREQCDADGVIFLLTKFCDPWAFDYPYLRETLEAGGIPSLLLEIEQHVPPTEQFKTRVGAFVEMLGGSRRVRLESVGAS